MGVPKTIFKSGVDWVPLAPPSATCRRVKLQQCAKIAELRQVLLDTGFHSLNRQAAALGLGRSTTWTILKARHKSSGLTASVIRRMLRSPELPPAARLVIEEYVAQKLAGAYGHSRKQLNKFQAQLALHPETRMELKSALDCSLRLEGEKLIAATA